MIIFIKDSLLMYLDQDSNKRVAYFYNSQIGKFHYGKEHPMKPKRIAMAHNLIVNYGYRNKYKGLVYIGI